MPKLTPTPFEPPPIEPVPEIDEQDATLKISATNRIFFIIFSLRL